MATTKRQLSMHRLTDSGTQVDDRALIESQMIALLGNDRQALVEFGWVQESLQDVLDRFVAESEKLTGELHHK